MNYVYYIKANFIYIHTVANLLPVTSGVVAMNTGITLLKTAHSTVGGDDMLGYTRHMFILQIQLQDMVNTQKHVLFWLSDTLHTRPYCAAFNSQLSCTLQQQENLTASRTSTSTQFPQFCGSAFDGFLLSVLQKTNNSACLLDTSTFFQRCQDTMGDKMLVLSWKYHNVTFSNIISKFRDKGNYSDVTVACEGKFYPAHKLVLAACSEYFEDMFQHTACKHPIVVLKDITAKNLEALLSYMYSGVANISQDELASLIRAAESLCIKGLAVPDDSMNDSTEAAAAATTTFAAAAAAKPKRRKKERCSDTVASQDEDYCEVEESSTAGECQEVIHGAEKVRGINSGNISEPPLLLPPASPTHNTGALECTPDVSFKSPLEDVVVKEELSESSPGLCYDGQLDCAPDGFPPSATTTGLTGGMGTSSQPQNYLCTMEGGGGAVPGLQQQQNQQQQPLPLPQQHLTEAGMPGSSGISQSLHETDGCYDGFPNLDSLNCEGQMELYSQFNLQTTPFHLPQLGMDGGRRGRAPKLAGGTGRGGRPRSLKVHRCTHCSYSTPWHSVFVRHCRTHSGEKPFICSFCPFRSSRKSVIKRHCLSKHS
ncbi:zinc finger and BTB domain-containing protein 8B-like isoform X3 [Scylla paramamosain]|uniref:zinc finger and BTB domain-containing protein 8B-like isoform X3 n=1 Tax=Scylla paramamosain TaxID=85552 RepID=UPI003082F7AC